MANTIDSIDFDTLAEIWLETYGNCTIRAIFENDARTPRHLKDKRAITKQITAFLVLFDVPTTPLCIERLINAIEPITDLTDYDTDIDLIEWTVDK